MAETATTNTNTTAPETGTTQAAETAQQTPQQTEQQRADKGSDLEKLIQSAVDRATNKLGNEKKKLQAELDEMRKAKLSDDELKELAMKEKDAAIAEREKAITEKENRWLALQAIKAAGLDDGSTDSTALVDFVMADSEEAIKARVQAFDSLVKGIVQKKVDAVFKANGRTPGVGTDSAQNAGGQNESLGARMGKAAAESNKQSQSIIDHYLNRR